MDPKDTWKKHLRVVASRSVSNCIVCARAFRATSKPSAPLSQFVSYGVEAASRASYYFVLAENWRRIMSASQ